MIFMRPITSARCGVRPHVQAEPHKLPCDTSPCLQGALIIRGSPACRRFSPTRTFFFHHLQPHLPESRYIRQHFHLGRLLANLQDHDVVSYHSIARAIINAWQTSFRNRWRALFNISSDQGRVESPDGAFSVCLLSVPSICLPRYRRG